MLSFPACIFAKKLNRTMKKSMVLTVIPGMSKVERLRLFGFTLDRDCELSKPKLSVFLFHMFTKH